MPGHLVPDDSWLVLEVGQKLSRLRRHDSESFFLQQNCLKICFPKLKTLLSKLECQLSFFLLSQSIKLTFFYCAFSKRDWSITRVSSLWQQNECNSDTAFFIYLRSALRQWAFDKLKLEFFLLLFLSEKFTIFKNLFKILKHF